MEKDIKLRPNGTKRVQTVNTLPSRTQQQFAKQCDVNEIIKKYKKTGTVTHVNNRKQGVYQDLVNLPDYHTAMETIVKAQQAFEQIPAQTRLRFGNDPQQLIHFLNNKENLEEAIKLGLVDRKPEAPKNEVLETLKTISENTKKGDV